MGNPQEILLLLDVLCHYVKCYTYKNGFLVCFQLMFLKLKWNVRQNLDM